MFGLFGSNAPQYQGTQQSSAQSRTGLLGYISRLFGGGGSPAYGGAAQPHSSGSGFSLFATSPNYAQPTAVATSSPDVPAEGDVVEVEDNTLPPPVKAITIIVKPGPGTSVDEVAEFFRDRCSTPRA